jgi:hypothetical protein
MATWGTNQRKNKTRFQKENAAGPRLLIYDIASGTIKYAAAAPFISFKKEYIAKIGDIIEESNQDYILKPAYFRYVEEQNLKSAIIVTSQEKYILQTSAQYPNLFEFKKPFLVNNKIVLAPLFRTIT